MTNRSKRMVLFVGAGASRACGYPVTTEILPAIVKGLRDNSFNDDLLSARRKPLLAFLEHLMPGSDAALPPSITEVLSIIDHCLDGGHELIPERGAKPLKLREARWLLERAIARVIRKSHNGAMQPKAIVDWIEARRHGGDQLTIISTNYDVSLDCALFEHSLHDWNIDYARTDFGFTWRDPDDGEIVHPSPDPLIRLYKLHGSLNWLSCGRCGHTYVNFVGNISKLADKNGEYSRCHCGHEPLRAVLVTPSFVRQYRDGNILSIWRSAVEALRVSDDWIFAGYSLPREDIGIRALLMRALLARQRVPRVRVVSANQDAEESYRQLFPDCKYTADGLRSFLAAQCQWH